MYDATIGRFVNEDPIGFDAGDPNLTRYVGNGVLNEIDPSGLKIYRDKPPVSKFFGPRIGGFNTTFDVMVALRAQNANIAEEVRAQYLAFINNLQLLTNTKSGKDCFNVHYRWITNEVGDEGYTTQYALDVALESQKRAPGGPPAFFFYFGHTHVGDDIKEFSDYLKGGIKEGVDVRCGIGGCEGADYSKAVPENRRILDFPEITERVSPLQLVQSFNKAFDKIAKGLAEECSNCCRGNDKKMDVYIYFSAYEIKGSESQNYTEKSYSDYYIVKWNELFKDKNK